MIIELNIGLDEAGSANLQGQRNARAAFALSLAEIAGYVLASRRAQSATEDTLIVRMAIGKIDKLFADRMHALAVDLYQDCIAVYDATNYSGELVGPNAAAWGEFNPEFFIPYAGAPAIVAKSDEVKVSYTGHAGDGGLQGHSVGSDYPYMVVGVQDRLSAPTEWRVSDTRTGDMSAKFPTYQRAVIEMVSLRGRNMMHS